MYIEIDYIYRIECILYIFKNPNRFVFGTAKPYGPSVQRMVDGGWISVRRSK